MKYNKSKACLGISWSALAALGFLTAPLQAQEAVANSSQPIVVSALRFERTSSQVASSLSLLSPKDLEQRGVRHLREALNEAPGVLSTSTGGQRGASGSLFIRGTNTAYSKVVIDGMPISNSNLALGSALGASAIGDVGRIEVLRGTQGAIYGGESIGGVVWLETQKGSGKAYQGSMGTELGAFNSFAARNTHQGKTDKLAYFLSMGYESSDNDAPDTAFHQGNVALRLDGYMNPNWDLTLTYRGVDSYFRSPSIYGNSDNFTDSSLLTIQAQGQIHEAWMTKFHIGFFQEAYDNDGAYGNYATDGDLWRFTNENEYKLTDKLNVLFGAFYQTDHFESSSIKNIQGERYGVHSGVEYQAHDLLQLIATGRWEDYDAYGQETTWRLGSNYHILKDVVIFKSGVGTSFLTPTNLSLFGSNSSNGNRNLEAEKAKGWDLGLVWNYAQQHALEVTYFQNAITNRIKTSFMLPARNIAGTTHTEGLEIGATGRLFHDATRYHVAYTHLAKELVDLPRNTFNVTLDHKVTDQLLMGVGFRHLSEHSFGGDPLKAYSLVRLFADYAVNEKWSINARLENALDKDYELANFYGDSVAGAGAGFYSGFNFKW